LIVLDASVLVCILLDDPPHRANALWLRIRGEQLRVPHLVDLEITQAFRRLVGGGALSVQRAEAALADLIDLPLIRFPHYPLLQRIWSLRPNVTPYDASYVALAELLDVPLLTLDARLARAASNVATVETF
jgi:predicted nucleic acid-binding protein